MSVHVHVSPLRSDRVYVRSFDYDEARRLRAEGVSVRQLATHYGVSLTRIYQVTAADPAAVDRRILERHRAWRAGICEDCGGPAMRLVGTKQPTVDGRTLCIHCRGRTRRTRFAFDETTGELVAVRCLAVDCANGERWQPPDNFPGDVKFRDLRPKGFHSQCRACNTRLRQQYRERHKVPCVDCGKPCLPAREKGVRGRDTGRCVACYHAARKAAA